MAYRLDVVAVQVTHEGSIVVTVVLRTKARRTVIGAASSKRSLIEGIDLLTCSRPESDMGTLARYLGLQQAELSSRVFTRNRLYPTKQHAVIVELLAHVHSKWFQHSRIDARLAARFETWMAMWSITKDLRCGRAPLLIILPQILLAPSITAKIGDLYFCSE